MAAVENGLFQNVNKEPVGPGRTIFSFGQIDTASTRTRPAPIRRHGRPGEPDRTRPGAPERPGGPGRHDEPQRERPIVVPQPARPTR